MQDTEINLIVLIEIVAFLASLVLCAVFTRLVRDFALSRGWVDVACGDRHAHVRPVPRLGGVAICLCFLVVVGASLLIPTRIKFSLPLATPTLFAILGPAFLIFLLGVYDDFRAMRPYSKFGIQILAAVWLYFGGLGIHRFDLLHIGKIQGTIIALPLTILWVLLITNAFNLIDGLDGLAAGSALFSTLVIFVLSLVNQNHLVVFLSVILAGAILGFLRFNFYPASIFLGDSGSLFVGFMVSAVALVGSAKAPTMVAVAIPVLSCGPPILDVIVAVIRRFLSGKPLFLGDQDHIHHRLFKRGFKQRDVVLILYGVSAGFGLLSIALIHGGWVVALVLMALGVGGFFGLQQLKYHEFSELGRFLRNTLSQKKIIANHLSILRATDALHSCNDFQSLCTILTDTLKPLGFDGFTIKLANGLFLPEPLPSYVNQDLDDGLNCSWHSGPPRERSWELTLGLTASTGDHCGSFSIFKQQHQEPLLIDINVLTVGFHTALADAVLRTATAVQGLVTRYEG